MTEDKPHIVFAKNWEKTGDVFMYPTYADAFNAWEELDTTYKPYLIATVGRVIDPAQPIIDVNE